MENSIKYFSFQGVSGAFSELAGRKIYPNADSLPCNTFEEMFQSVRESRADRAIVPIENSKAGRIADTQRLIPNSQLKIVGEFFFLIYFKLTFLGSFFLIWLRCSPFWPTIVNKEIFLQKGAKCREIAAAPPRYSSVFKSLKTRTGSFPDFPKASQKKY